MTDLRRACAGGRAGGRVGWRTIQAIDTFARQALRTLLYGYREVTVCVTGDSSLDRSRPISPRRPIPRVSYLFTPLLIPCPLTRPTSLPAQLFFRFDRGDAARRV